MERVPQGGSIGPGAPGGSDMNMNVNMVGGGSEGDGTPRETIVGNECHVCGLFSSTSSPICLLIVYYDASSS